MKVIISHDVDHLFRDDHYCDLIYPKLWVRSTLELLKKEYGVKEWLHRMANPFHTIRHHIFEVMELDQKYGVPSTFFFGMRNGLGMSYSVDKAADIIREVDKRGFDVGVHGIEYESSKGILEEYEEFSKIINRTDFGIRMHYVRFDERTFEKLYKCGYMFDTTEFDKNKGYLMRNPYRIGTMWEFPLVIMDGYLPLNYEKKIQRTKELIKEAEERGIQYLTILFHDYQFCDGYATERDWYRWIVDYLSKKYKFVSYRDAIRELEN